MIAFYDYVVDTLVCVVVVYVCSVSLHSVLEEWQEALTQPHMPGNGMQDGTIRTNEYVADVRMVDMRTGWLEERRTRGPKAIGAG